MITPYHAIIIVGIPSEAQALIKPTDTPSRVFLPHHDPENHFLLIFPLISNRESTQIYGLPVNAFLARHEVSKVKISNLVVLFHFLATQRDQFQIWVLSTDGSLQRIDHET
jgi:hypothetical protein